MEKPAPTQFPIHDLLRRRWSPLAFSNRPVSDKVLCQLMEAARWTPSSFNEQPWSYLVATQSQPEEFQRMLACLVPANAAWAQHAPVLMISVASLRFARNGNENRHAMHDVGAATANLTLQAMELGLRVHQMAGFDLDQTRTTYQIPETHLPAAAMALGYPGDAASLPPALQQRESAPRSRKALSDLVHSAAFGRTPDWIS